MKRYFFLMSLGLMVACNGSQKKPASDSAVTNSIVTNKPTASEQLIIPGQALGTLRIGLPVDSAIAQLGQPDSSDAGMGSALMSWYSNDGNRYRTAIFARRNMGNDDVSRIEMIMTAEPSFKTKDGMGPGSSLADIEQNFSLKQVVNTAARQKGLLVYNDADKGIIFDIDSLSKKCVSVTVHEPKDSSAVHLNIH